MKQIRTSAILLLAALLPTACTQEEAAIDLPGSGTDTERVEITPSATVATSVEVSSRAPIDETVANTFYFKRADETTAGTYGAYAVTDFTATRAAGTGAQGLTFAPLQYYSTNGLKSKITGYYPAATATDATRVQWTLDGTQDVMTAPRLEGSKGDRNITGFVFTHRLAQLRFYPYATAQNVANQWGKITKIEVLSQPSGISYPMTNDGTGNITATTGTTTFTVASINNATIPVAADGTAATTQVGAGTMVLPQANVDYALQIKITTEKKGEVTVTRKGALAAATPYKINLRFTPQGINVEAVEIADWQTGGSIVTYPCVKANEAGKMSVIVSRDLFGEAASTRFHEPWFQTPDHGSHVTPDATLGYTVAPAFEVEATDSPTDVNWVSPNGTCKAPWRRPTVSELLLIASLQSQLTGVQAFNGQYWTAARANWYSTGALNVVFPAGTLRDNDYNTGAIVYDRCVKDIFTGNTYPYVVNGYFIVSKDEGGSSGAALHENWPNGTLPHNRESPLNSVSARFEVAQADAGKSNWDRTNGPCDVANGWRRPTLAEMQLLVKMKLEGRLSLTNITGFHYNTATQVNVLSEDNNNNYWAQCDYEYLNCFESDKWVSNRGNRCIKDF